MIFATLMQRFDSSRSNHSLGAWRTSILRVSIGSSLVANQVPALDQ